jgi:UDP-N-acetylglucosamine acyltransferase
MTNISPLAFVDPDAKIGNDVTIEAFAYIDRDVVIGDNCHIRPRASILKGARIGNNNIIYEGAIISANPQDFRWHGEDSKVIIGDNNLIREYVIINRSIHKDQATTVGSNSFIMAQTHIGHDSNIGNFCVLGNGVKIAGNCKIGNYTILSSAAVVHEHCEIGDWVLVKGGCRVNGNVPPYIIVAHNPIEYSGVNAFIMRKGDFSEEIIDEVAKSYRHLYQSNTSAFNAYKRIEGDIAPCQEKDNILSFLNKHEMKVVALPMEEIDD